MELSPQELANAKLKSERIQSQQESIDERRLDWLDVNKESIQEKLGIEKRDESFEYEKLEDLQNKWMIRY
jgi:hypothetical protein